MKGQGGSVNEPSPLGSRVRKSAAKTAIQGRVAANLRHLGLVGQFALLDEAPGCRLDEVGQGAIVAFRRFAEESVDIIAEPERNSFRHDGTYVDLADNRIRWSTNAVKRQDSTLLDRISDTGDNGNLAVKAAHVAEAPRAGALELRAHTPVRLHTA